MAKFSSIFFGLILIAVCCALPNRVVAEAYMYPGAEGAVIGQAQTVTASYDDTLLDIGRRHGLGYTEMVSANPGVDIWLPGEGSNVRVATQFVLPDAPRKGIVINLAEYRLYYYGKVDEGAVLTFPISIGKMDWQTPLGRASIVAKQRKPAWYPPKSVLAEYAAEGRPLERIVPPGPDNPLGDYAMRLSIPGYLIHGTNRPAGVGMRVTHGCIRMFPEDIDWLFPHVSVNTPVTIVNQPFKFGWRGDELLFEAHAPLEEDEQHVGREMTAIIESYVSATGEQPASVDWGKVERVQQAGLGVPVVVGRRQAALESDTTVARAE